MIEIMNNHPYWFTIWLFMVCGTIELVAGNFKQIR